MNKPTYNTRTLAACAKRLRHIQSAAPAMPGWAVVWRLQEGFRLQVAGEIHERDGWIYASSVWGGPRPAEIARDVELGRADEIATECLRGTLKHQPEDLTLDQLHHLARCEDNTEIAAAAQQRIRERTALKVFA